MVLNETLFRVAVQMNCDLKTLSREEQQFITLLVCGRTETKTYSLSSECHISLGHNLFATNCNKTSSFLFTGVTIGGVSPMQIIGNTIYLTLFDNEKTSQRIHTLQNYWKDMIIPSIEKLDVDYKIEKVSIEKLTFTATASNKVDLFDTKDSKDKRFEGGHLPIFSP